MRIGSIWRPIKRLCGKYPVYLAAFCIHIPLSHYEVFSGYYDPIGTIPAIGFLSCLALLIFAILRFTLRNTQLAGLAALIVLMLLFPKSLLAAPFYPIIGLIGICMIALRIAKREGSLSHAFHLPGAFFINISIVAIVVLAAIAVQISMSAYQIAAETNDIKERADVVELSGIGQSKSSGFPDIVHIVLDGYSRADVLQSTYNFDNAPFLNALRERGFRVLDRAQTPYNQTLFVMSSIFALAPIDGLMPTPISDHGKNALRRVLARSVSEGPVLTALNRLGYDLQSTPSAYLPLQLSGNAETVDNGRFVRRLQIQGNYIFSYDLLTRSPILSGLLKPLIDAKFDASAINFRLMRDLPYRRFAPRRKRPRFIYQHILAPHPPFNISADGSLRPIVGLQDGLNDGSHLIFDDGAKRLLYREGYLEKLKYVNHAILSQIDHLQETRTGPLIIILHGDHGGGLHLDQDDKAKTCLRERFSPLFAVYATDEPVLTEFNTDFNIVNTYRAVFRAVLKSDLPDGPNLSKFVSWELDNAAVLHPEDLTAPCTNDYSTEIADRPTLSPNSPASDKVTR